MSFIDPKRRNLAPTFLSPFSGKSLEQSNITKFLGVYIGNHLTWKHNIGYVYKQIATSISIIFRSHFFLSSTAKLTLFYTLIYPYIIYCNSTWSSTDISTFFFRTSLMLQKQAVQAIANSDCQAHSAPLFSNLRILDIFQVNMFDLTKFIFYY